MHTIRSALAAGIVVFGGLGSPPSAAAAESGPSAAEVIVRGRTDLADALAIGVRRAFDDDARARAALLVLDVTPYTAAAEESLLAALLRLDARFPGQGRWTIAPLGGRPGREATRPSGLAPQLTEILRRDTRTANTLRSLAQTLRGFTARGGAVVYLADWHFEDDERLERFIAPLVGRSQSFSVVGSEAAYLRGWNDGFFPPDRGRDDGLGGRRMYDPDVGRNPFGSASVAPWHGGDTAYPHLPSYYQLYWDTLFPAQRRRVDMRYGNQQPRSPFEDSRERLARLDTGAVERYEFTLPSGFGPYGLMRAARQTGGRYVLWSWNPNGRSDVRYDFSRLDLLAPDLRRRSVIRKDRAARPLAAALLRAWQGIANRKVDVARTTAPLEEDLRTPREMVEVIGAPWLSTSWRTVAEWRAFLRQAQVANGALDRSIAHLVRAEAKTPRVPDDVDRRLLADARLLRQVLTTLRFHLGEMVGAARTVTPEAWDRRDTHPVLRPHTWTAATRDPDALRPQPGVAVFDRAAGDRLLDERRVELRRYRGTPQGEQIGRNSVLTFRVDWRRTGQGRRGRESPAESPSVEADPAPVTPGGSGAGAAPSTGK